MRTVAFLDSNSDISALQNDRTCHMGHERQANNANHLYETSFVQFGANGPTTGTRTGVLQWFRMF